MENPFAAFSLIESCDLFRPLIALHASDCVTQLARRNGMDFAEILAPYAMVQINIRDPTGQQISHNLRLDIRDIRTNGFLLSHTVFRFVLQEAIFYTEGNVEEQGSSIFERQFYHTFMHWLEPSEHEYLRSFIACIFVVSANEPDPMNKFAELESEQHREQHGTGGAGDGKRLSPAYCASTKWFFPNILKFYVLIHDHTTDSPRSKEIFALVCSRYGRNLCYLLQLGEDDDGEALLPDLWTTILQKNKRGLAEGLELAKRNLLIAATSNTSISKHSNSSKDLDLLSAASSAVPSPATASHLASVSSAPTLRHPDINSPPLFTTSTLFQPALSPLSASSAQQHQGLNDQNHRWQERGENIHMTGQTLPTYAQAVTGSNDHRVFSPSPPHSAHDKEQLDKVEEEHTNNITGQWLTTKDRQRLRRFVEEFVRGALVPFVEKQLAEQNEIVQNRRSLAKSTFNSMRKWLGAATNATVNNVPVQQSANATVVSYSPESAECQARRLADLAFLFGHYQYSHQMYQSLKKDFANDQAWLYHAGSLEMAGISSFLSGWQQYLDQQSPGNSSPGLKRGGRSAAALSLLRKQYPQRYLDNAVHFYANVCRLPLLALRALMTNVQILTQIENYTEAAQLLIRFSTSAEVPFADLVDATLLEHAARLYTKVRNRRRKKLFYLATAGTRLSKFSASNSHLLSAHSLACSRRLAKQFFGEVLFGEGKKQEGTEGRLTSKGWHWAEHYLLLQYMGTL